MIGILLMGKDLDWLMEQAISEAKKGLERGEVPVGAVLADPEYKIVAKAHNQPILLNDPTAHAEILVLRAGGEIYRNYRLNGFIMVVTIEPCLMCMGAAINARISRLVFGAYDPKSGAAGSLYNPSEDKRLNHSIEVIPGVLGDECGRLLKDFFRVRRKQGKNLKDLV